MKKIVLYLFAVLASSLVFNACEDPYADQEIAAPTVSEQEALQSVDGFTFALGKGINVPVVLSEDDLTNDKVYEALVATATPELAEGASVTFQLEVSDTQEFLSSVELPSVSENNTASVKASDLNEVVKTLYGKAPNARELYLRAKYYIVDGTILVQAPAPVILGPITVTPVAPVIETEYYLIGGMNDWNFANLDDYKFSHPGGDVYENSIFTILVNLESEAYFKIVPKSSKDAESWDGLLGNTLMDGNIELTGELAVGAGAMKIIEPGWAKITLNMMEYTYSIELIGTITLQLYVPGGHQGWSPSTAPTLYTQNYDFKYEGYVFFDAGTEFKFTSIPDWTGTNYGNGGDGTLSIDGNAGNLSVTEDGYYKINVDLSGSPYTYALVKTDWGLIGDATVGGWDNSTPMTYNASTKIWTVSTTLSAGKAFKFRANNGWDINLGGNTSNLSYGGDNIPVSEDGTYFITLDLSDPSAYKCMVVKQ